MSRAELRAKNREAKLAISVGRLRDLYDRNATLNRSTDAKAWVRTQIAIEKLESRIVALVRPRTWRIRDLRTGGIREREAAGATMREGKLLYGDKTWPAAWSFAGVGAADAAGPVASRSAA
jgi:hypothetical protein